MFDYEISYPDFPPSEALTENIEKKLSRLDKLYGMIIFCQVNVRLLHKHSRKKIYHIQINLKIPGDDVFINTEPERNYAHADPYVAVRDAFKALDHKLESHNIFRKKRNKMPHPVSQPKAKIISFDPNTGYGFIRDRNGRELYFHKNSIINEQPENINIGDKVRFAEERGEEGPQVSSMSVISAKTA